jgi:hypothetical protein
MKSSKAVEAGCCRWNLHCVEGWRAQDRCVVRAERLLYLEVALETVVVCQGTGLSLVVGGGPLVVSMEDNFAPEAVVHILETQAVEVRWVGRIDMEGKVVGHSVEGAGGPFDWGARVDVSWLVGQATGN